MIKPVADVLTRLRKLFSLNLEIGISIAKAKENSIIFLPYRPNILSCGISALVAFKGAPSLPSSFLEALKEKAFF